MYNSMHITAKIRRTSEGSIVDQSIPSCFTIASSGCVTVHILAVVFFAPNAEVVKFAA
jgi:hypothetical protein